VAHFAEEARHQRVLKRVVRALRHLGADLGFAFLLTATKRELQEHAGAALLSCLLLEDVLEQIFVALDKPLRVGLTVFDLLLAVALDALHQRLHRQVLLCAHLSRLTLHLLHHLQLIL